MSDRDEEEYCEPCGQFIRRYGPLDKLDRACSHRDTLFAAPSAETPSGPVPTMEELKKLWRRADAFSRNEVDDPFALAAFWTAIGKLHALATRSASAEGPSEDAMDWEGETRRLLKALIPEGSDLIQRVTQRALELRLAAPPSVGDTPDQVAASSLPASQQGDDGESTSGSGNPPAREPDADALELDAMANSLNKIAVGVNVAMLLRRVAARLRASVAAPAEYVITIDEHGKVHDPLNRMAEFRAPTGTPRAVTDAEVTRFLTWLGLGDDKRNAVRQELEDFLSRRASRSVEAAGGEDALRDDVQHLMGWLGEALKYEQGAKRRLFLRPDGVADKRHFGSPNEAINAALDAARRSPPPESDGMDSKTTGQRRKDEAP